MSESIKKFIRDLPDPESAGRFFNELRPSDANRLRRDEGLFSDIIALASFSPLLATTILQNPQYISWLGRKRKNTLIPSKEELLESLGRFSLTHSQSGPAEIFANFRRRELLRIYLKDIRRITTIAEVTEELSNLADSILENALNLARQELNNRYGMPQEEDSKGRKRAAKFCIVALGKLGSNELNYSSDIDLLFIYSQEGETSGHGARGETTNREYFVKLSEFILKLMREAYRVDMRLRPHGRVGALALSVEDTVRYYEREAQDWERQVMIRSRGCAGDTALFRSFFDQVEDVVFSKRQSIEEALLSVKLSKEKINLEKSEPNGFNVKLGIGGIREIEFIAQALQLAYGGKDEWLRSPHTLISLSRLADRGLISDSELTRLFEAYDFLRRLEHRLQMEHGLQTHFLSEDRKARAITAKRMGCESASLFDDLLAFHTRNVNSVFTRVFSGKISLELNKLSSAPSGSPQGSGLSDSLHSSEISIDSAGTKSLEKINSISPFFAGMVSANPALAELLPNPGDSFREKDYLAEISASISKESEFSKKLAVLRRSWSKFILEIAIFDIFKQLDISESKNLQTQLAEASLAAALDISRVELEKRFKCEITGLPVSILGLGKLGGKGMDYGSDLDLIFVYDDRKELNAGRISQAEFFTKFVEIFVNVLSSFTREGNLYRIDLRLRPDGKNGPTCIARSAFLKYLDSRAAIWELLAYVKIRCVIGDKGIESEAKEIIYRRAGELDPAEFKLESHRMRERLEQERSSKLDIKFGEGGMLDVYFAMRYLQLRDGIPDDPEDRATLPMLKKLLESDSLSEESFHGFYSGYEFLGKLDHALRLTVGRSNQLPNANLDIIADRLGLKNGSELIESLAFHRLNIRAAYENILL